jgi:hypothetical protein
MEPYKTVLLTFGLRRLLAMTRRIVAFKHALLFVVVLLLAACAARVPSRPDDMCTIFREFPDWYKATERTEDKWGTPIAVQMAIMYHESAFKREARPPRKYFLGIIPLGRPTTAYSYSQALDSTWVDYKKSSGNWRAQRNNFGDASDFVGWFSYQSHRKLGIAYDDAYALYLAYHEGWGGYAKGTYNSQTWLIHYAQRVQSRATLYQFQLEQCKEKLDNM